MNIILTCAGRRSQIVEFFKEALGSRGKVFACDSSPEAPALNFADDACIVPPIAHPDYIDALLQICRENRIGLLIPAFEPELPLLALHQARFRGIGAFALVSSPGVVETCYDKLAAEAFLTGCGIANPKNYLSLAEARAAIACNELAFPLIVKPRWGVGSLATETAEDDDELELVYNLVRKRLPHTFLSEISATDPQKSILIQPKLSGVEYGLDIVNDLGGHPVCTFAKRKLRMHTGQTDRAITLNDPGLEELGRTLGSHLGHLGLLDCDVIVTERQERHVLDLNPRIGGGYPFSHSAGANFPAALIAWLRNEEPNPAWFKPEPSVLTSRCDWFEVMTGQRARRIL